MEELADSCIEDALHARRRVWLGLAGACLLALVHSTSPAEAAGWRVPRLTGDSWIIAGNPYLGELTGEKQQPVDFSVWQARDGTWQLWSCIRNTREPGNTRLLYRWEGADIEQPHWQPRGIAMHAEAEYGETPGGLQAPFVSRGPDGYLMVYGDWEHICAATSSDGESFTRRLQADGHTGMFTEGRGWNTRDPMLLRVGDRWHCYYTAFPDHQGADFVRTSLDTVNWNESRRVAFGGEAGTNPYSAECPFVIESVPGEFYLFRTQRYGREAICRVYHSRDPFNFGIEEDSKLVTSLPVAAPEIVHHDDRWFIAYLRPPLDGIKVSRLEWVSPDTPPESAPDPLSRVRPREPVRSFEAPKQVNYHEPSREYVVEHAQGWTVQLEKELVEDHAALAREALKRLDAKLSALLAVLPENSHERLRGLPIFLLLGERAKAGGRNNGAEYFQRQAPESYPLIDPRWGGSLVIYSARNYVELSEEWALRLLVHEFAHAWQLEQWPEQQPDLMAAFRVATARGLYRDVKDINNDTIETAYAAQNQPSTSPN